MSNTVDAPRRKAAISVFLDNASRAELKQFHCSICGMVVFEFYDQVRMIVPGVSDESHRPFIVQCNGRRKLYRDGYEFNIACKTKYHIL